MYEVRNDTELLQENYIVCPYRGLPLRRSNNTQLNYPRRDVLKVKLCAKECISALITLLCLAN